MPDLEAQSPLSSKLITLLFSYSANTLVNTNNNAEVVNTDGVYIYGGKETAMAQQN